MEKASAKPKPWEAVRRLLQTPIWAAVAEPLAELGFHVELLGRSQRHDTPNQTDDKILSLVLQ
jgi:hypothetical protein